MRIVFLLLAAGSLVAGDTIQALGFEWDVDHKADWSVTPEGTLRLLVPRPSTQPRRPTQYALARTAPYRKLTLEVEVKKEPAEARQRRTSLMFVYAWRGRDHFNYAHISVDAAKAQPVHNGLFHVYGGDRVRISPEDGPPTLMDESWHKVRLTWDASSGRADVWVNGQTSPSMRAVDLSLGAGRFGLGSFFDMGEFRNLKVTGDTYNK